MRTAPALLGLPLLVLLLALSAGPAAGRLLKDPAAVSQEPFLLRVLKELLPAMAKLAPDDNPPPIVVDPVDAPGESSRNASDASGAGIMPSVKTKAQACEDKQCPEPQTCEAKPNRKGSRKMPGFWGKCICPEGYKKPEKDSPKCVDENTGEPYPGSEGGEDTTDVPEQPEAQTQQLAAPEGGNGGGGPKCSFDPAICDMNRELMVLINRFRQEQGNLRQLCINNKLIQAAKGYAEDCSKNPADLQAGCAHTDSRGKNSAQRIEAAGFEVGWKENTGKGMQDPQGAFNRWRDSTKGHRETLLFDSSIMMGAYTEGSGVDKVWVLDFGDVSGGNKEECNAA